MDVIANGIAQRDRSGSEQPGKPEELCLETAPGVDLEAVEVEGAIGDVLGMGVAEGAQHLSDGAEGLRLVHPAAFQAQQFTQGKEAVVVACEWRDEARAALGAEGVGLDRKEVGVVQRGEGLGGRKE